MVSKESEKDINERRRRKKKSIILQDEQQEETRPHPQRRKDLIKTKQKQQDQREIYVWRRVLLHKLRWSKPAAKNKTKTQMEICKERFNIIQMMGVFRLDVPQAHTERHRPDRQRGKEMRKTQWKSRKAKGSREEKRETKRSVHKQVEQHLQERINLLTLSLSQNTKTSKPNNKKKKKEKTHKRTKKREIAFDSPPHLHTEKIFGNNKYKLQKTTKQNKTKTEKIVCCKLFCSYC